MHRIILLFGTFIGSFALSSCQPDEAATGATLSFTYTFEDSAEDWTGGFADYPVGEDAFYEVFFQRAPLPPPLDEAQQALKLSGNNHSDDLFMFIKRKISGLSPGATYAVTFTIELASEAPAGSVGIGGSPATSVYLKAGATQTEPAAVAVSQQWQMNIDKGNQSQGGAAMGVLGNISTEQEDFGYTLINRNNEDNPFIVTADSQGEVWVILGTDSGFEGTTTLYYNQVRIDFREG